MVAESLLPSVSVYDDGGAPDRITDAPSVPAPRHPARASASSSDAGTQGEDDICPREPRRMVDDPTWASETVRQSAVGLAVRVANSLSLSPSVLARLASASVFALMTTFAPVSQSVSQSVSYQTGASPASV